jgi:uncharacterized membrane protein
VKGGGTSNDQIPRKGGIHACFRCLFRRRRKRDRQPSYPKGNPPAPYLRCWNHGRGKSEKFETLKREEKFMKKMVTLLVVMLVISVCPIVQAFDGRPPHGSLGNLPADKEMLFHQTMRGVRDHTKAIHEQIKVLEAGKKDALTAAEFSAPLFLQKTRALEALHRMVREAMDQAMADLASQYTAEERAILADLISRKPGPPPGPPPSRWIGG